MIFFKGQFVGTNTIFSDPQMNYTDSLDY